MSELETETETVSPEAHYVNTLRSKVANLNDENVRLEAQISFQAQVIADLQKQVAEHGGHSHEE